MHSFIFHAGMLVMLHTPPSEDTTRFPYAEHFDSIVPPDLPSGWTTSQNKSPGINDFTTTTGSPRSVPNALLSTNATIEQSVVSPDFDFRSTAPDSIVFFSRRSSSHLSPVLLEVSLDGGQTFPIGLGDTLTNPGGTDYVRVAMTLPDTLATSPSTRFRWRTLAGTSGTTGTLRIDDIFIGARVSEDLALVWISISPVSPGPTDPLSVVSRVANVGRQAVSDFTAALFLDSNRDSVAAPEEQVGLVSLSGPLEAGDSADAMFTMAPLAPGAYGLIATVSAGDGNPMNDTLMTTLPVRHPAQALVINEIMFDPPPGVGEYLELFNPGIDSIDPGGWVVRDRPGTSGEANEFALPGTPCPPGGFIVLAEDSTVLKHFPFLLQTPGAVVALTGGSPSLNNEGDNIVLQDPAGGVVDSVPYLPSWHHPEAVDTEGKSLEKIHPLLNGSDARNWSTSAASEGGTPALKNSLYATVPPASASLTLSPNPFSPDGDGRDDMTILAFEAPPGSSTFSLRIYDIEGRLIRQLATNELTGPTGRIVWDGLDDQRRKARIGMYVVYLEILGARGEVRAAKKEVVVLAGRL